MAEYNKNPKDTLVDEKQALGVYLESLLRDVPEADETFPELETVTATPAPLAEVVAPVLAPVVETRLPEPEIAPQAPPVPVVPVQAPVVHEPESIPAVEAVEPQPSPWEGRPEWAEEPFQALLFKLSGLTMAIPLIELDGILEWPSLLTPLPNRSPWYLGLLDNRGKTLPVIELAQLVIPANLRQRHAEAGGLARSRIILIGDGRWGVACDSVSEVVTLHPDEVRWRSSRTKRKWLAGTLIDHMCALLDAQGLVHLLSMGQEESAG